MLSISHIKKTSFFISSFFQKGGKFYSQISVVSCKKEVKFTAFFLKKGGISETVYKHVSSCILVTDMTGDKCVNEMIGGIKNDLKTLLEIHN